MEWPCPWKQHAEQSQDRDVGMTRGLGATEEVKKKRIWHILRDFFLKTNSFCQLIHVHLENVPELVTDQSLQG